MRLLPRRHEIKHPSRCLTKSSLRYSTRTLPRHSTRLVRSASSREELCERNGRTLVTHGERWRGCLRTRGHPVSRRDAVVAMRLRCVALRCAALRCAALRRVASPVYERFTSARCPFTPSFRCDVGMRPANTFIFLFSPLLSAHPPATRVSRGHVDSRGSIRARYHWW